MTCIVAVVDQGEIVMGADSLASNGWSGFILSPDQPKIFNNGPLLIGITGSIRFREVMCNELDLPKHLDPSKSDMEFLSVDVVKVIRTLLKDSGIAEEKSGVQHTGPENHRSFALIGYRGKVYNLDCNFAIYQTIYPYHSEGSGEYWAMGSLHTTEQFKQSLTPEERIKMALDAASEFCPSVRGPYVFKHQVV